MHGFKKALAGNLDDEGVFHGLGVHGRFFAVEEGQRPQRGPIRTDVHEDALVFQKKADGPLLHKIKPIHLAHPPAKEPRPGRKEVHQARAGQADQTLPLQFGKGQGCFKKGDDAVVSRRLSSRVHGSVLLGCGAGFPAPV